MTVMLIIMLFFIPDTTNATSNSGQTNNEYKYTQNISYVPKFTIDVTNKNYLLITLFAYSDIDTKSIEVYKYNSGTKKFDTKISTVVLKENVKVNSVKKTTIRILRKDLSSKSENVNIKLLAANGDKNANKVYAYLIIKPLAKEKNNRWYSYVNAPRMSFTSKSNCVKEADVLKRKIKVNFEDTKGIEYVKIYDLNSSKPKKEKVALEGRTCYVLDLSQYTVKKAKDGKSSCRIRFEIKNKSGGKRIVDVYFSARKYKVVHATSLKLNSTNIKLEWGDIQTIKPTVTPSNATEAIKYTTSNKNIVAVTQEGKIVARGDGTATITAKVENLTKTCKVTVKSARSYENTIHITKKFGI